MLEKVLTNAYCGGILAKLSARDTQTTAQRTLKIKQCKTRTKTHTIPVNSYSVLRRIRKQEIVFKQYDARRQNELQTQK